MKTILKPIQSLVKTMPILALAASLLLALGVQAQVTPTATVTLTNLPSHVTGGAQSNLTVQWLNVRQNKGMGVDIRIAGTNAVSTGNVSFQWGLSSDGTNAQTTTSSIASTLAANGTNTVIHCTNFPSILMNNFPFIGLLSITNANASTNAISIISVTPIFANTPALSGY
jgi:hypothetical protein